MKLNRNEYGIRLDLGQGRALFKSFIKTGPRYVGINGDLYLPTSRLKQALWFALTDR